MEIYENESDQTEAVKRFFAENGKALLVGVVIGIGALLGWRYWTNHKADSAMLTSQAYQKAMFDLSGDKPAALAEAEKFAADTQNVYGALAALKLAQQYADKNALAKAAAQLQLGLKNTRDANLQAVMSLRLSRIQIQQKQADEALKTLDTVKGEGWKAIVADVRGEALLSKGDRKGARDAWSQGVASDASAALREMMQMKINNLSS
ncbi:MULTISPECIES: YfgM family protein [Tenebrionibacter/Tenebrionicola group]|jgi:predicted negative regulator of RcsB-dependent stress response|uniref:YfgM family protein n=2 Tax=Tenebrionibacter/Tenebrionicola group TaxID=2969848 RepID=A0A8K0XXU1_9ENTR|nr:MULTISPECIES: YfgM family protein [Tenebrionibacter/Tenebrionicola group]MBK4716028.1 YfgM family protein [Tenebrionibacter intestinalis]MBV4411745.1 YfgM family protein [Tenebrionicola larvae]MBV5096782.1 YfgM family protein [Tenebrionicola larvae]